MKIIILSLCALALFSLTSCSAMNRFTSPGPAAQLRVPSSAMAGPHTTEFDILRLRIMERMANGTTANTGGAQ